MGKYCEEVLIRGKLTEGKEERRPSPVASISRSVSSVPFSLDLADVNNRTRIVAKNRKQLYQGNPVNVLGNYFNERKLKARDESTTEPYP
jgi:hypothetical protein